MVCEALCVCVCLCVAGCVHHLCPAAPHRGRCFSENQSSAGGNPLDPTSNRDEI